MKANPPETDLPIRPREMDISEDMIGKLSKDALNTMGYTIKGTPKPVGIQDIERIYREALRMK